MIWIALAYLALAVLTAWRLRRRWALFQRLNDLNWDGLVTLDILAGFAVFGPLYLLGILRVRPEAGETISSFTGRYAAIEAGWAVKLAAAIDALFFVLTSQRDHCLKEAHKRG